LPRVISSDDHADLGHDTVKQHLARKFHEEYDRAVDRFVSSVGITAEANARWREQQGLPQDDPSELDLLGRPKKKPHPAAGRPGHTDPKQRLADMDIDGVDASVTYCEVSAFRFLYLLAEGSREATRAFNTALAEFGSADPARLVMSYQIPIHDIDGAIREVEWVASIGGKSLQLPVFPVELGLPDYWDIRYEPLWSAIQATGLPICCHVGLNTQLEGLAQRDPTPLKGILAATAPLTTAESLWMWIMGGVFERFPDLKVVFVEPGVSWVSWWLNQVDDLVLRQGYVFPAISELPSHYFHRNVYLTFIDEPNVVRDAREGIGIENVMWSSDYPHPISSWPKSRASIESALASATAEERELIVAGNAARVWNL
jgi:predicted TIM-barrel fold metal-dependent hydrolase